jgi:rhodanese-related sulfurtransferase
MTMIHEVTAGELAARRKAGERPFVLDVRESWERDIASLPDTVHIPMSEVPARLTELDRDREIIVMCRSGGRSMQVAQFLSRNGFTSVANLAGGILAWSRDVDATTPTY